MALVDRGIVGESGSAMGLEVEERRTKEYAEHRSVEEWVKGGSNPTPRGLRVVGKENKTPNVQSMAWQKKAITDH